MTKREIAIADYKRRLAEDVKGIDKAKYPMTHAAAAAMGEAFAMGWDVCVSLRDVPDTEAEFAKIIQQK